MDGDMKPFEDAKKGETINYNINSKCTVGHPSGKLWFHRITLIEFSKPSWWIEFILNCKLKVHRTEGFEFE